MYNILVVCACVLWSIPVLEGQKRLPSFAEVCKRNDPQFNECVKDAVNVLRPRLANGVPNMRLPKFNPFHVSYLSLDNENAKLNFQKVDFGMAHNFDLKTVNMDLEKCRLEMNLIFPLLPLTGVYEVNGRVLIFDLHSGGTFKANCTNNNVTFMTSCEKVTKKGKEFLKFGEVDLKLMIGDLKVRFDNLFPNNDELTDRTNQVFNENSDALLKDFEPFIATALGKVIESVIKGVFDYFPYDLLIPK